MTKNTRYVGLDVHKDAISVAVAEVGREGEVRYHGVIGNTQDAVKRLIKQLGDVESLDCCYEAGPCGYVVYWWMTTLGVRCRVVAPNLIPKRVGDRVKTDRKDAENLARLHRSGELRYVQVPDKETEALRDLVRAREAAIEDQLRARQRLSKFLLRRGLTKPAGWSSWTQRHLEWVGGQESNLEIAADRQTFADYLHEVEHVAARIGRLDQAIDDAVAAGSKQLQDVVEALGALKGVGKLTATTLAAEVGSFSRFESPTALMSYCGLVPSEHSSGGPGQASRGRITKTGNAHLRRVLLEAAWHYARSPRVSLALRKRQANACPETRAISWRAQHRLNRRYHRLVARGKAPGKAATAVARELLGFIWDIAVRTEEGHQRGTRTRTNPQQDTRARRDRLAREVFPCA